LLIPVKITLQRDFYAQMCCIEQWSVKTLRTKMDSMLFERTAISKKPDRLIKQELKQLAKNGTLTPDLVFKDPYFLDFTGLKNTYSEKSLEDAILNELEQSGIKVAEYLMELPDRQILEQKLHAVIKQSRLRLQNDNDL
jgi:predicted nuclease of restriction endonuclease-like (RecB) superfamily